MPYPITGTPLLSSRSSVAGTSSSDLAPEQTTQTAVLPISWMSAEMSIVCCQPRCTPPIPPVAMKWMPAMGHTASVPATVVAPRRWEMTPAARSRGPICAPAPRPPAARARHGRSRPAPSRRSPPRWPALRRGRAPPARSARRRRRRVGWAARGPPARSRERPPAATGSAPARPPARASADQRTRGSTVSPACRPQDSAHAPMVHSRRVEHGRDRPIRGLCPVRAAPRGGERPTEQQLRHSDLPGLHGRRRRRQQVPGLRAPAAVGPRRAPAVQGTRGARCGAGRGDGRRGADRRSRAGLRTGAVLVHPGMGSRVALR